MRRAVLSCLALWLLAAVILPARLYAAEPASFSLQLSGTELMASEQTTVRVVGQHLSDVYGYEVKLSYDYAKLDFVRVDSGIEGFAIEPIIGKGEITFAATQLGTKQGRSGEVMLAAFVFEAVEEGEAAIALGSVKLVDSQSRSVDYTAGSANMPQATVEIKLEEDGEPTEPTEPGEPPFSDISGWAEAAIIEAYGQGWINGYADGTFRPNQDVTRAQFITMLVRAAGIEVPSEAQAQEQLRQYADAASIPQWAAGYLAAALEHGLLQGYSNNTLQADRKITRSELAVIGARALELATEPGAQSGFADREQIPAWAEPAVAAAQEAGLIQGRGNNRFAPLAHTTRAEAVTIVLAIQSLN